MGVLGHYFLAKIYDFSARKIFYFIGLNRRDHRVSTKSTDIIKTPSGQDT